MSTQGEPFRCTKLCWLTQFCPTTNVDTGRTFSVYKTVLTDTVLSYLQCWHGGNLFGVQNCVDWHSSVLPPMSTRENLFGVQNFVDWHSSVLPPMSTRENLFGVQNFVDWQAPSFDWRECGQNYDDSLSLFSCCWLLVVLSRNKCLKQFVSPDI